MIGKETESIQIREVMLQY